MKKYLILIFVLIFVSSVYACPDTPGRKGIEVDGTCFDCGENDNVCPEDFGVDCSANPDPDCEGFVGACECQDYDGDSATCNAAVCEENCFYLEKWWIIPDACEPCIDGESFMEFCEEYDNEGSCTADNCGIGPCEWDSDLEECTLGAVVLEDCEDIDDCGDYSDPNSCNADLCVYDGDAVEGNTICQYYEGDEYTSAGCYDCYVCVIGDQEGCVASEEECLAAQDAGCDCADPEAYGEECVYLCSSLFTEEYYEEQPFPVFTWFNVIIASVLITGFYVFRRK